MKCQNEQDWNDWRWQLNHSIIDAKDYIDTTKPHFRMRVTPYYFSLIDFDDPDCPIRRQVIPVEQEMKCYDYSKFQINDKDSLAEDKMSPVHNLVHRYPDRVLLLVTTNCFSYCRFCTRKRLTSRCQPDSDLTCAYAYIREHTEIRDVLISGGDPLTLTDDRLEEILSTLRSINHVEMIRIGTRAPVVLPMRITKELVDMLKKYHPLYINTHFNHPKEITEQSAAACQKLADAGIPMGNQSVLLKGVNDNVQVYKKLCTELLKIRVKPYYLYQCDIGSGTEHFRTTIEKGLEIMEGLRQHITGLGVPLYVIDAPNGGGKIPISPEYIVSRDEYKIELRNSKFERFVYPEPYNK